MSGGKGWQSVTQIAPSDREPCRKRLAAGIMKSRAQHHVRERPRHERRPVVYQEGVDPVRELLKEGIITASEVEMDAEIFEAFSLDRSFWKNPCIAHHPLWTTGDYEVSLRDGWHGKESYLGIELQYEVADEDALDREPVRTNCAEDPGSKFTIEGAIARGLKGKFIRSDFPLLLEMHDLILQGEGTATGMSKRLAEKAQAPTTDLQSRAKRLERKYLEWERLGE